MRADEATPPPSVQTPPTQREAKAKSPTSLECLGQTYELHGQRSLPGVDEAHYYLEDQGPESWTQRLIIQRLRPKEEHLSAGPFLRRLQEQLGEKSSLLQEGREAALLFCPDLKDPATGESCHLLCLAFLEEGQRGRLRLLQYLQKTAGSDQAKAQLQLEAWKERLLQAARRHNFPDKNLAASTEENP